MDKTRRSVMMFSFAMTSFVLILQPSVKNGFGSKSREGKV